ncbi:PREDICTED: peroxiredoxin [Prunus dulcis]|nr:PREDICTED: peroxiredoxin [Prunus dulcis]
MFICAAKVDKGKVPPAFTLKDQDGKTAFAKKYKLPYTLLSDEGNKVRKEWGVPSDLFGTLPGRQTYVLDKNGVVQLIYNNQFQPEKLIDETLKFLQSL